MIENYDVFTVSGESKGGLLPVGGAWIATFKCPRLLEDVVYQLPTVKVQNKAIHTVGNLHPDFFFQPVKSNNKEWKSPEVGILQTRRWQSSAPDLSLCKESIEKAAKHLSKRACIVSIYCNHDEVSILRDCLSTTDLHYCTLTIVPADLDASGSTFGFWAEDEAFVIENKKKVEEVLCDTITQIEKPAQAILDPTTQSGYSLAKACNLYSIPYTAISAPGASPNFMELVASEILKQSTNIGFEITTRCDTVVVLSKNGVPYSFRDKQIIRMDPERIKWNP